MNEDEYLDQYWEDRISGYSYEQEPDMYDHDYEDHRDLQGRYRDVEEYDDSEDFQDFS